MNFARAVWPLAAATFASGTQAYVFAGLLGDMALDLNVSIGGAGQLATAYAVTFALAAPFAGGIAGAFERRRLLMLALIAAAAINGVAALAPTYSALFGLRIAAGLAATFVLPIAASTAIALAPPEARGRALALVAGGTSIAFVFGIPTGSGIGGAFGWRATFIYAALISLAAAAIVRLLIPPVAPSPRPSGSLIDTLRRPGVMHALACTFLGFAAMFTVVAYVGPVVTAITGATGGTVGLFQLCVGFGSLIGVPLGGALTDRGYGRAIPLSVFSSMIVTLSAYSLLLGGGVTTGASTLLAVIILIGAASLFTLIPAMQARLVASAPDAAPLLLGLSGSIMFLGQGAGAMFGGFIADHVGFAAIGVAGAAVAAFALAFNIVATRAATAEPAAAAVSSAGEMKNAA